MSLMPTDAEIDEMSEEEHETYLGSAPGQELDRRTRRDADDDSADRHVWLRRSGAERGFGWLLLVCGLIGIIACWELISSQLDLLRNPDAELICDVSPLVSCGDSLNVWQGNLLGVPNSFIGAIAFGALTAIGAALLSGVRLPRWMWWGLSAGSLGGIAFVIWFLSVSIMTFGKLCPFCMVIWSVTIPVAAHSWAWAAAGGHLGLRDNQALDLLKARWWVMAAMYLAVVLTIIIAFGSQLARFFG